MNLFGHNFTAAELGFMFLGTQWALSALAHALPKPAEKCSPAYLTVYNLVQFLLANLGLMKSGQMPPCEPPPDPKIIKIDRAA